MRRAREKRTRSLSGSGFGRGARGARRRGVRELGQRVSALVERMANVCGGRCGSGCSTSLRPSPRAVATARAGRTAFRLQAKRDDGEEDPLRERIYLEEGNRGRVSKPEPLPVTPSSAYLQRSRGVWQVSPAQSFLLLSNLSDAANPRPKLLAPSPPHHLASLFFAGLGLPVRAQRIPRRRPVERA